jgi:hypothetical protein
MKYESEDVLPRIFDAEQFNTLKGEKVNPDLEYSGPRYTIVPIERSVLAEVSCALADWAESNAQDEDFDEDGKLKNTSFHEDEIVSRFLASMFEVTRKDPEFAVTVVFHVRAQDEEEARAQVEDVIGGYIESYIDNVEEA